MRRMSGRGRWSAVLWWVTVVSAIGLGSGCGVIDALEGGSGDDVDAGVTADTSRSDADGPFENECGGSEALDNDPGQPCGPCDDGTFVCDSNNTTICSGAGDTNACGGCTELAHQPGTECGPNMVRVCDGEDEVVCKLDDELPPPTPTNIEATNSPGYVAIEWDEVANADGYKVFSEGDEIAEVSKARYEDDGAPAPTIGADVDSVSASRGVFSDYVELGVDEATVEAGATVDYRVLAFNDYGESDVSGSVTGQRIATEPVYQWQESEGEADDNFDDIPGADQPTYEHVDAPPDGSPRHYRVVIDAEGTTAEITPSAKGYVMVKGSLVVDIEGLPEDLDAAVEVIGPDGVETFVTGSQTVEVPPGEYTVEVYDVVDGLVEYLGSGASVHEVESDMSVEVTVHYDAEVVEVEGMAAGGRHTCAVLSDGSVRCWGENQYGQLGDGTTIDRDTPVEVEGLNDAVTVDIGLHHSCALRSDESVRCWGHNASGQLGDDTTTDRHTPVDVDGLSGVVDISVGGFHACAVLSDGAASCWGRNAHGQLGDDTTTDRHAPVDVDEISDASVISTGHYHSCALLSDDSLQCWGRSSRGQVGDGHTSHRRTPVDVDISAPVAISTGYQHTCAVLADGTARCWGRNAYGSVGDDTTTDRSTPVEVSGLSNAVEISSGEEYNCALLADGSLRCWGRNTSGQLGDATTTTRHTPVITDGVDDADTVTAGGAHTCSLLSDGSARCWGGNSFGQIGDGTTTNHDTAVDVEW